MPGHTHIKLYYQFKKAFDVYLHIKDRFHPSRFSMRYCKDIAKLVILGTLEMTGYANPK